MPIFFAIINLSNYLSIHLSNLLETDGCTVVSYKIYYSILYEAVYSYLYFLTYLKEIYNQIWDGNFVSSEIHFCQIII